MISSYMRKILLLTIYCILICFGASLAQTGPAGVGNSGGTDGQPQNVLWLNSGIGITEASGLVSNWADQSGNGLDAIQGTGTLQPSFTANNANLNNQPTLSFTQNQSYLGVADNTLLDNGNGFSFFIALRTPNTANTYGILNKRTGFNVDQSYRFFQLSAEVVSNVGTSSNNPLSISNNTNYIVSSVYDGTLSTDQYNLFLNSTTSGSSDGPTTLNDEASDLVIGNFNASDTREFPGDIGEIIIFKSALNAAQRIIIENYLSLKYNIGIGSSDYFGNYANYDNAYTTDLTGIGTVDGTNKHSTPSVSTGGLAISEIENSLNQNNEFVFVAHNGTGHNAAIATELGEVEITSRWQRDYYIEQSRDGTVDNASVEVNLTFDFDEAFGNPTDPGLASQYVLLYRANSTGDFTRIYSSVTKVGNTIVCGLPSILLKSGYYTLGIGEQIEAQTWYSYKSGTWNDATSWTLDGSVAPLFINPNNEVPDDFDNVVITSGRTITMDINSVTVTGMEVIGTLDLSTTNGHDFTEINGRGIIKMQGWDDDTDTNTPLVDNFPIGIVNGVNGFADTGNGGTLELYGEGVVLNTARTFRSITVNMANTDDEAIILANYIINGELTINNGTLKINDDTETTNLSIDLYGDYYISTNGFQTVGTANARHDFNFYANFTNFGDVRFSQRTTQDANTEATDGIVDANFLSDDLDQTILCNGSTYFYRIVGDKGSDETYILDLQSSDANNFVLTGAANVNVNGDITTEADNLNALAIIKGTIKINENVTINPLNNSGNYSIPTGSRLWVNGGTVVKNSATAIVPYGTIEISNGYLEATGSSGLTIRDNGRIQIDGGTVLVNQIRTSIEGADNIGGYVQTGGTVTVNGGLGGARDTYAVFSLTYEDNVFIMTGGTLNVTGAIDLNDQTAGNSGAFHGGLIFINSDPGNINVSGGTVNITTSQDRNHIISSRAPFYNLNITNTSSGLNAKVIVTGGTSGDADIGTNGTNDGGTGDDEWRTITAQTLKVLNDLTLTTGTTRTSGSDTYGAYLDFCSGSTCANLEVGGNLTINDQTVLDIFNGNVDNTGSSSVTFNGSTDAVLTIGDVTSYTQGLTGFYDPEDDSFTATTYPPYQTWEFPFYDFTVDKPGATLTLNTTGTPDNYGDESTYSDGSGNKNINGRTSNLIKVAGDFILESGTVDNDVYSMRFFGDITNKGILGVNTTPVNALLKLRKEGTATTRIITTTDGAEFGNLRLNIGESIIEFTSDVYVKRLQYRFGRINIGSYNLKVDLLVHSLSSSEVVGDDYSIEDMIIMDGNASDGGLSLYVGALDNPGIANHTDSDSEAIEIASFTDSKVYHFPIGTGTTGTYPDSRYTPANIRLNTFYDDGYITVNVVNKQLQTAGPHPLGNDVLNRYWRVRFDGFTAPPLIDRHRFHATEADIPDGTNDTEMNGISGTWRPGYVLDGGTYDRTAEENASGTSRFDNANSSDEDDNDSSDADNEAIRIFFFGEEDGSGSGATPFTLIEANYTAGDPAKFTGAPEIYYSRQDGDWHVPDTWSDNTTDQHEGVAASDYPQIGDVVFIGGNTADGSHAIVISEDSADPDDIEVEEVILNGGGSPSLLIQTNGDLNSVDLGVIKGEEGTSSQIVREIAVTTYTLTADIGDWSSISSNTFQYKAHDSGSTITLPTDLVEFPNFTIAGNRSSNKSGGPTYGVELSHSINVRGDLQFRSSVGFNFQNGATGTVTVAGDVNIGSNNDASVAFPQTGLWIFDIDGDLGLLVGNSAGWGEQAELLVDENATVEHFIKLGGDLIVEERDDGVDGAEPNIDLYANTGGGGVVLELTGTTNAVTNISNSGGGNLLVPDLYKVVMNKNIGTSASFSIDNEINLVPISDINAQPIEIVNGLLILNNADIDITLTDASTGDFYLPNTSNTAASSGSGGLEIAAGTVNIEGDDTGIILDGLLRVSGGTLNMLDAVNNGNNFIEYSSSGNAQLELTSGNLSVGSQVRRATTSTTGVLQYLQSGGTAIFGRYAAPESSRGVFEVMNTGSSFTHTGGSFTIYQSNGSSTVPSLFLSPTSYSLSDASAINLGTEGTTLGQTMGLISDIPLNNLTIAQGSAGGSVLDLNVQLYGVPLVTDTLRIGGNDEAPTFDANGFDLTINESLINDNIFQTSGNVTNAQTTYFPSSGSASISGTGTTTFWKFNKTGSGTLTLSEHDVTVGEDLRLESGTFETGDFSVTVKGDVYNDATHSSSAPNSVDPSDLRGIVMAGNGRQKLERGLVGTSYFGTLTIDNANSVIIEDETFYTFQVDQALVLRQGVLDISSNLFVIGENATIQNSLGNSGRDDFNLNNMVQTNSTFQDFGLRKMFTDNTTTDFVYPIGQQTYTPMVLEMTAAIQTTSASGSLTVRPSNEPHPTVNDHDNTGTLSPGTINDRSNVLQYHWILKAEDIESLTGNIELTYDQDDVSLLDAGDATATVSFTEDNYAAARLLFSSNSWDKVYDGSSIDATNNRIFFNASDFTAGQGLNGGGSDQLTGDYTAGILVADDGITLLDVGAIPNTVPEYESLSTNGEFDDFVDWNGINGTADLTSGEIPIGAILYIRNGDNMNIDVANARIYRTIIENGATLEITENASNTRLGIVEGTGTLKLSMTTPNSSLQLPAGYYEDFLTCNGGMLEFAGTVDYEVLAGVPEIREVAFSGSGNRGLANSDLLVCEDLIINDNVSITNTYARDITVKGNIIKSDNSATDWVDVPVSGRESTLILSGTTTQFVSGNLTGSNAIFQLEVNNNAGVNIINTALTDIAAGGDVEISDQLTLTNGLVSTDTVNSLKVLADASIVGGGEFAYINGPFIREMRNGSNNYFFPIGTSNRYGRIDLESPSGFTGIKEWTATYFYDTNPYDLFTMSTDATSAGVEKASTWEYWNLDAVSPANANIRPYWDTNSDVTDLTHLRVIYWDGAAWDVIPEIDAPTGSADNGNLSAGPLSFSTKTVSFGTTNQSITLLPVELLYFRGEAQDNGNILYWATASEVDNSHFEILRSLDGKNFNKITTVPARGGSDQTTEYKYTDKDFINSANYYILRQVDKDGNYTNSEVIFIKYEGFEGSQKVDLVVYPNPVTDNGFELFGKNWLPESKLQMRITDITGNEVYKDDFPVDENGIVQYYSKVPENLSTGIYIISVTDGQSQKSIKVLLE